MQLGRQDAHPALDLAGRVVGYAELDRAVRAAAATAGPIEPALGDPVDQLITVLAAAHAATAVLVADPLSPLPPVTGLPDRTFLAVVTSGSTGRPRVLLRTADSWERSFPPFTRLTGITPADAVLLTAPLHSTMQLFAALHALWLGATVTDRPERATVAHAVPTTAAELTGLRLVVVAGAALPPRTAQSLASEGIEVVEYYGAAELSFVAIRRPPGGFRPFPDVTVRSVDGLLRARSPYLASGFLAGPLDLDAEGFATAGDLGTVTPEGAVLVHGRGEAAVTVGGQTIVAEDVEAALAAIPGVREAAVVGLPHPRLGELLTAVVVADPPLAQVRARARTLLRGEALPRKWVTVDRLPRTTTGKVARAELRSWLEG